MAPKYFEELEIWKASRELTCNIYKITNSGLFAKDYDLKSQIRRAAASIMSNIAEGHERSGNPEFIQFFFVDRQRLLRRGTKSALYRHGSGIHQ
jgi:hypothetical protein